MRTIYYSLTKGILVYKNFRLALACSASLSRSCLENRAISKPATPIISPLALYNREFKLSRRDCREVFLYAIKKAPDKYQFKLYALCIMSNPVHYLIEPAQSEDLPKIMHFLNWYTAMCFNRMLKRTGHFWEKRYYCDGFAPSDRERALNTLRYIHGNPKAAKMRKGFFYDFSNYGSYERLTDDGLTQWHPAFLQLGSTLEECAQKYRGFCQKYKPKGKPQAGPTGGAGF